MASWRRSSDPGAPAPNYLLFTVDLFNKANLIIIENVKGAVICLQVLEDANSCFAEPALRLLRITLECQRKSAKRRQSIFSKAIFTGKILRQV